MRIKQKTLKLLPLIAFLAIAPLSHAQSAQNNFTMTTLGAAIGGGSVNVGTPAPTIVQVVSATNIVGLAPNLQPTASQPQQTSIYVDRELMSVVAVNGTVLTVVRGQGGTVAVPHAKGAMVLAGYPFWFSVNDPGGSGGFSGISNEACTGSNTIVGPRLNTRTGAQWICSTITATYVPGFNNSLVPMAAAVTTAVASGTTITPSGPLFHLTGTTPVTTITTPVGCNATAVGGCSFTVIADTGTSSMFGTGGNLEIGAAITTLTGNQYVFVWDATSSKWCVR